MQPCPVRPTFRLLPALVLGFLAACGGQAVPNTPCPAPATCQGPGVRAADGSCIYPVAADGTECNDGDDTTSGDACLDGACHGAPDDCVGDYLKLAEAIGTPEGTLVPGTAYEFCGLSGCIEAYLTYVDAVGADNAVPMEQFATSGACAGDCLGQWLDARQHAGPEGAAAYGPAPTAEFCATSCECHHYATYAAAMGEAAVDQATFAASGACEGECFERWLSYVESAGAGGAWLGTAPSADFCASYETCPGYLNYLEAMGGEGISFQAFFAAGACEGACLEEWLSGAESVGGIPGESGFPVEGPTAAFCGEVACGPAWTAYVEAVGPAAAVPVSAFIEAGACNADCVQAWIDARENGSLPPDELGDAPTAAFCNAAPCLDTYLKYAEAVGLDTPAFTLVSFHAAGACDSRCGDGKANPILEECDDGNLVDGDACTNTCRRARCGDGIVRTGVEACDDGNTNETDGCVSDCTTCFDPNAAIAAYVRSAAANQTPGAALSALRRLLDTGDSSFATSGSCCPGSQVVVASVETYLKYAEAVGATGPVTCTPTTVWAATDASVETYLKAAEALDCMRTQTYASRLLPPASDLNPSVLRDTGFAWSLYEGQTAGPVDFGGLFRDAAQCTSDTACSGGTPTCDTRIGRCVERCTTTADCAAAGVRTTCDVNRRVCVRDDTIPDPAVPSATQFVDVLLDAGIVVFERPATLGCTYGIASVETYLKYAEAVGLTESGPVPP